MDSSLKICVQDSIVINGDAVTDHCGRASQSIPRLYHQNSKLKLDDIVATIITRAGPSFCSDAPIKRLGLCPAAFV